MESEGSVTPWLATEIEDPCPGFLEHDRGYSAEHPHEGFLTPVRLGFWIDDHVFDRVSTLGRFRVPRGTPEHPQIDK